MMNSINKQTPVLLSIAPINSVSDFGITSDIKTFSAFGCFGLSVVTGIQDHNHNIICVPVETFNSQLEKIFDSFDIDGIHISHINKTPELIDGIIENISKNNKDLIVLDLSDFDDHQPEPIKSLINISNVVVSNINESKNITGIKIVNNMGVKAAAKIINNMGADNVVISDNDLQKEEVTDYIFDGIEYLNLPGERNDFKNVRGIGSSFSAAITASLAYKRDIIESTAIAKSFACESALSAHNLGNGLNISNPLHTWWETGGTKGYG